MKCFLHFTVFATAVADNGMYGCGLLGNLPGVTGGVASAETQKLIDGLKANPYGKVSYWNWGWAPETVSGVKQALTSDFLFMPDNWGMGVIDQADLRPASQSPFVDTDGDDCPATMGDIVLGSNEPDISGSCMGGMFGKCTATCTDADVADNQCPICHLDAQGTEQPNQYGRCNCWSASHATGVGFWPLKGCNGNQPLPQLFGDPQCVEVVRAFNAQNGGLAHERGYKYFTTPLFAANMSALKDFVRMACTDDCKTIDCGCPSHVAWHFYASDCRPKSLGGYQNFQDKLQSTIEIMEEFPHIQGAIVNEVGMLNCAQETPGGPCIADGGMYPASKQPGHTCPATDELPNGLVSFIETLIQMAASAKTSDGRPVVSGFSWFQENQDGGTYDLRFFDDSGNLNTIGETYISQCQAWHSTMNSMVV